MKSLSLYFGFLIMGCFLSHTAVANDFIPVFEDIPMMDGLRYLENEDVVFGNEESSYRETHLISNNKKEFSDVVTFYQKTLPQLGWNNSKVQTSLALFERENSILEIRKIDSNPLKISISLKNEN